MAEQGQVARLRHSVDEWNLWRQEQPLLRPDLSGANLRGAWLSNANLREVNLIDADLRSADLSKTVLSGANLSEVNLTRADLTEADLSNAILTNTNLSNATLRNVDFSKVQIGSTLFANNDLSTARGLSTVIHNEPSSVGIDTIYRSQGNIPEVFLRSLGVPDTFITYARALVSRPIEYYTCFVSYSSKDEPFARRLYADLQSNGVRCWFAPENLRMGDRIRPSIDEAIRLHDKLLLVLSQHSLESAWVEKEVAVAFDRERREKQTILFPIGLDDAVMQSEGGWPALVRNTHHIADFERWKDDTNYQKAFSRLMRNLTLTWAAEANERQELRDEE
jgi:TIR domain/Pentapeptide repeats (8 copies)